VTEIPETRINHGQLISQNSRVHALDTEDRELLLEVMETLVALPEYCLQSGHGSSRVGSTEAPQWLQLAHSITRFILYPPL